MFHKNQNKLAFVKLFLLASITLILTALTAQPHRALAADTLCFDISGQGQPITYEEYANSGILKFDSPYQPDYAHRACERDIATGTLQLEGWVWNSNMGWISLYCDGSGLNQGVSCGSVPYGVTVNKDTGELRGFAWGDNTGYISFSCEDDTGGCTATNTHKVFAETDPDCIGTIYSTSTYPTPPNCPAHSAVDAYAWNDTVGWMDLSGVVIPFPPRVSSLVPAAGPVTGNNTITINGDFFQEPIYFKEVNINNTNGALTDYQVSFTLDTATLITAGKMRSDCGDLQVYDSNQTTPIPYYINLDSCNTANTQIWTKTDLPASSSKTIYASYNGKTFTQYPEHTFNFYEDFEYDLSQWTQTATSSTSTIQLSNSSSYEGSQSVELYQTVDDGDTNIQTTPLAPTNSILEMVFYDANTTPVTHVMGDINFYAGVYNNNSNYYYHDSAGWHDTGISRSVGWHTLKMEFTGSDATTYIDNTSAGTSLLVSALSDINIMQNLVGAAGYFTDFVRLRQYVATEPSVTYGAETSIEIDVEFGANSSSSITYIDNQTLSVVVPTSTSGTGPVDVIVTNPDGQTDRTPHQTYNYNNVTDPDASTFTATPTTVMADGISTSLLTATLLTTALNPVPGANVSIDVTGATVRAINCQTSDVGSVTPGVSNANGQACFLATSSTLGTNVEFTATDTTNVTEITEKAYVSYINCLINKTTSTFVTSKAQVETDGVDSADLDLHLVDYCGFNIDKTDVTTLDDDSSSTVTYTPPGATAPQTFSTAGGGLLNTVISSLTAGLVTFDAGLNEKQYDTTTYNEDPSIPNEYNGSGSLITGSDNQDNTEVSFNMPFDFTLYDQTVTTGNPVYLCTNGYLTLNSDSCSTSGNLTDAIAGYHMDLTTNGGGIYQRSTANSITFIFDAESKTSENVNFEIKLYSNNRIEIHYDEANTISTPFIGLYNHSSTADSTLLTSSFTNKATAFEYNTPITAFDLDNHPQVEFLAGDTDPTHSTVIASPSTVTANGNEYSIITVTVLDINDNPVPNKDIQLDQTGGATVTQVDCADPSTPAPSAQTDANGQTCYTATNTVPSTVTFTATDITDLPLILGSDDVVFGCVVGPNQQCVQISVEAGVGSITMSAPDNFSFLPSPVNTNAQERFTCDEDPGNCTGNATGYIHNLNDILSITDTRNNGGYTVQVQAATTFENLNNNFVPFQNFFVASTPASTGGTQISGIEYDNGYSGSTCSGAPLNTAGSLLSPASFLFNFGSNNTLPSNIYDLMQCDLNPGQGRIGTMKQNINYYLNIPGAQPPGSYEITLTFDLII